jgi:hypothetical protein
MIWVVVVTIGGACIGLALWVYAVCRVGGAADRAADEAMPFEHVEARTVLRIDIWS